MEWRTSWNLETLLFIAIGSFAIAIWEGGWILSVIGFICIGLTSWFLTPALKEATILEYLGYTQHNETNKTKMDVSEMKALFEGREITIKLGEKSKKELEEIEKKLNLPDIVMSMRV